MSVNNLFTGQQAVSVQPSVDDIFKLYVSSRLRRCPGFDDELNLFLDKIIVIMEKSIPLTSEQQLTCLEGLSNLEIYQRTEQVYLNLESFQSMTVVLFNKIASMFQDGEITWRKIFQILDAVAEVIANIPEMVYLVDQLCHYSETMHVSSRGQTIAEWISTVGQDVCTDVSEAIHMNSQGQTVEEWIPTVGQEVCTDVSENIHMNSEGQTTEEWTSTIGQEVCTGVSEALHMNSEGQTTEEWTSAVEKEVCTDFGEILYVRSGGQTIGEWISPARQELHHSYEKESKGIHERDVSTKADQSVVEKPLETPEEYTTKCPCGYAVFWCKNKQCKACQKYPCVIDGCSKAFKFPIDLHQHYEICHTREERQVVREKRRRFEDCHCAHCGAPSPARGVSAHTECFSCKHFICLRGHCRVFFARFHQVQTHQAKCSFFFPKNKCGFCGGDKIKPSVTVNRCPNANCTAFWCSWCDFESNNTRSLNVHRTTKHSH